MNERVLLAHVVDMTCDGARLELFAALELPEQIYLWERRTNPIFECNVIWRLPGCAGVRVADRCGRSMRLAMARGNVLPDKVLAM
jgi:hypothetical protein